MTKKRFESYGGLIQCTGSKIISAANVDKRHTGKYYTGVNPDSISLYSLVKHHLCKGEFSDCVSRRACDCLDVCRFGQRYIALTKETKETTI